MPDRPDPPPASVAQIIRQWRLYMGWSQEDLERQSGVSQKTISSIESGKIDRPQDRTLRAIVEAIAAAAGSEPGTLLRYLKEAKETPPDPSEVSPFARAVDARLAGLGPIRRAFVEDLVLRIIDDVIASIEGMSKNRRKG